MKKSRNIQFEELLKQRRKLCKESSYQVEKITMKDSQLKETIKNFNEGNRYKNMI